MSEPTINLNAHEAQANVYKASLSAQQTADYLTFIHTFPDTLFFINTTEALTEFQRQQGIQLPAWFLEYRQTLAEAYAGADNLALQFAAAGRWYTLILPGLPKGKKERQAFLQGSATVQLFPIALDTKDDRYQLGINLSEQDTRIYQYQIEDINAAYSAQEDISTCLYPLFASPAQMLGCVRAIRHGTRVSHAKNPHQSGRGNT